MCKTCKKCGWVYPASSGRTTCIVCGEPFTEGPCALCGEFTEKLVKGKYCRKCYDTAFNTPATRAWRATRRNARLTAYKKWQEAMKRVPDTYPVLTDKQWLAACAHFGGCAFCGSESIDARVYFISFAAGGKYHDWNILPACERCATQAKDQPNPFIRLETSTADKRAALDNIIKYLEVLLDKAANTATQLSKQYDNAADTTQPDTE